MLTPVQMEKKKASGAMATAMMARERGEESEVGSLQERPPEESRRELQGDRTLPSSAQSESVGESGEAERLPVQEAAMELQPEKASSQIEPTHQSDASPEAAEEPGVTSLPAVPGAGGSASGGLFHTIGSGLRHFAATGRYFRLGLRFCAQDLQRLICPK
ncbi:MAG: hypothetical protein HQL48_06770 [Gammaproteobacteria bacterium]|nr:hypothetical protein [Gammaproteobacteria bacterium]